MRATPPLHIGARICVQPRDSVDNRPELDVLGPSIRIAIGKHILAFRWGREDAFGTAAYWLDQTRQHWTSPPSRFGTTLREELIGCLLCGYGTPSWVGLAALAELRARHLLENGCPSEKEILEVLALPFPRPDGSGTAHYRFARTRARQLAAICSALEDATPPDAPLELRTWLQCLPGIGPKTASWVVRNHLQFEGLAVLDRHVLKAGRLAGFFHPSWQLPSDYFVIEATFLAVAAMGCVSPTQLDACIWWQLQHLGPMSDRVLPTAAWYADAPPLYSRRP
jgi:N-glycosylase/DNA lyase